MGQITATVIDAADIRAFDCLLPDDAKASDLAVRLAKLMHLPELGSDGYALNYGLVVKGGNALNPSGTLRELDLANGVALRIVPEVVAGSDEADTPEDASLIDQETRVPDIEITVSNHRALLHDEYLGSKPEVRIDTRIHKEIEEFAKHDRFSECAGLLLGFVSDENGDRVIHISAIAPAVGALGNKTSVKITIEAWEAMLQVRDRDYADLRVLGWFHTHAGWGVFLSDSDVFIHKQFFPHPNMLAYVLDPTTGSDGFFYWLDGKLTLAPSYGLVGTPVEVKPGNEVNKPRPHPVLRYTAIAALLACVIFLGVAKLHEVKPNSKPKQVQVMQIMPKKDATNDSASSDQIYSLSKRENLWMICRRVYGDGDLEHALADYNNIDDVTGMQIGQKIKLPVKEVLQNIASH